MQRRILTVVTLVVLGSLGLTACTTDSSIRSKPASSASSGPKAASPAAVKWFDQALYDKQEQQLTATFTGDASKPYLQYLPGPMTTTAKFKANGPQKVCFSNASISNPWRQTGWITMNQQLKVLQAAKVISTMETRDAKDSDDTQISDIDYFIKEGRCDLFLISPNSTAAMTPAVERACATGKPVIVFDRGVQTKCTTSFVHPVGGFAFGIEGAKFIASKLKKGDKVVALRILPGVDVLEQRWAAAKKIFGDAGITATDYFTGADPVKIKKIISDELAKGNVQGVWMDAGDGGVAAVEAFEDAGKPYPVMSGEDQIAFMKKWQATGMTAVAPSYPSYQWRTALLAAEMVFKGRPIPTEWILPQPSIEKRDLASYLAKNKGMPDGHYAFFGGEDLPGFPQVWIKRVMP